MPEQATRTQVEILYNRYGALVYRRCLRILGTDAAAWDATQEVCARVMRHYGSFRAEASPLTWILRISTNHCLNVLGDRRGRRSELASPRRDLELGDRGDEAFDGAERFALIRALLVRFDPDIQRPVIHRYVDGMTEQEVASVCGLPVATVRKRLEIFARRGPRYLQDGSLASFPAAHEGASP